MIAWLPVFDETEDDFEYLRGKNKEYTPWIVCPSGEARLDEYDPYGVTSANFRPRLARDFSALCSLTTADPFGRVWHDKQGRLILRAQAWGRDNQNREEGPGSGLRLFCKSRLLKKILGKYDKDLLLLINLQRYEKKYREGDRYTHTVAVVRIDKALKVEYFKGRINHLYKAQY